jgi:GGDEF domain-containing protein
VDAPAELDAIELLAPYDAEAALERAVRLCEHLAEPRDASGEVLLARAQLVEADRNVYRAKTAGRDRLVASTLVAHAARAVTVA